jgi:hypothetical protein
MLGILGAWLVGDDVELRNGGFNLKSLHSSTYTYQ